MDGILGLGYGTISVNNLPTFIDSAEIEDKSFGFYLQVLRLMATLSRQPTTSLNKLTGIST